MDKINYQIAAILREQIKARQNDYPIKLDSERILSERLGVGRQRIRAVVQLLISEGLLIKEAGRATYIMPHIRSRYINLICSPNIKRNDPFYNKLLMELTNAAAKECVNLVLTSMEMLSTSRPSNPTLMVGRFSDEDLQKLIDMFPTLIAFEDYPDQQSFNQIYFNHYRIGYSAAKLLCEHGHKRLIHLTGPKLYESSNQRRNGFMRGCWKYGAEYTIVKEKMNFAGGYNVGPTVIKLIREKRYTAVFVANDWMAVGLMQYLKEHGVTIPEQVSVIGVDNIDLSSQISPALTTFSLDVRMMVTEVFSLINYLSSHKEGLAKGKRIILEPVLMTRDSLRELPQKSIQSP